MILGEPAGSLQKSLECLMVASSNTNTERKMEKQMWPTTNSVLPSGELVLTQDLSLAIWLGRCESSDEHILAKANGNSLVTSTSVTRLSLESSMELALLKSTSIPALEPPSVAYLEMAKHGTQPIAQAGGDEQLRMEHPPQASNHQPQHKLLGKHQQTRAMSFQLPPGLAQPSSSQASSCDYHQNALQLHTPGVQQPASSTQALINHNRESKVRRQLSARPASSHQPVRSSMQQKGSSPLGSKLTSILDKARSIQEVQLAVNVSEADLRQSHESVHEAQLQAYLDTDLTWFSAEEIKEAKLKDGESLRDTYESVIRASFTPKQLQQVIQTTWVIDEQASQDGATSLRARIVNNSFKQRILDRDLAPCPSTLSHMSLKIVLTLSLINKWDVITTNICSTVRRAPIAIDALVLVQPPPELEQNPDVLWKLTHDVYGLTMNPMLWQQKLASKFEELGLQKNTVEPSIFTSEQLIVMHHSDTLLIVGDTFQQESFISQLSSHVSLNNTTKLDAKTPLSFSNKTLEDSRQDHSISLHLPASFYMNLFNQDVWRDQSKTQK